MRDTVEATLRKFLRFVKPSGPNNLGGPCPFHKEGKEAKPSFYMNVSNGLFFCHSCHASGTFVQFLRAMGASSYEIDSYIQYEEIKPKKTRQKPKVDPALGEHILPEGLLGIFDYCPKGLKDAGFDPKLMQRLGVGFHKDAMRITFPIRDCYGNLVGINGRTVIDEWPRYKVYKADDLIALSADENEGRAKYSGYDIKNHNFLWNMHNVFPRAFYGDLDCIIIVEGYKACMWLLQHGVDNVVALQGSRMTRTQELVLSRMNVSYILFLDNNKAGREGAYNTAERLRKNRKHVFCVNYPEEMSSETQPDSLDEEEIMSVLDDANPFHIWRQQPWNIHLAEQSRTRKGCADTRTGATRR